MNRFVRLLTQLVTAAALTLVVVAAPGMPSASAAPAPWTWKRVTVSVNVQPYGHYSVDATCPSGYSAITGGLALQAESRVYRSAEYRYADGSGWHIAFENDSNWSGGATVIAECVLTTDLPPLSYNRAWFTVYGWTEKGVACANPGEVVVTGGVDWDNVNTRQIYHSAPGSDGESWHAKAWNRVAGAKLAIEVWCTDPANLPGYRLVEHNFEGGGHSTQTLTCPYGMRVLSGGTHEGSGPTESYASYPRLNRWTASFVNELSTRSTRIRVWCVDAGTPTVAIHFAQPGNGVVSSSPNAEFFWSGSDPAGFGSSFYCSLDGSWPTTCTTGQKYDSLSTGTHTFTVFSQTGDGRQSKRAVVSWTVDRSDPAITPPSLKPVTLAQASQVSWAGVDQQTGIDRYEAAYWLAHADGTTVDWAQPAGWNSLETPTVQLPTMAPGDTLCLSVRAVDKVGNTSPWTVPACTSRPFDDRALTPSTGWTRGTGSSHWLQTVTSTTASAETLKRHGVHLDRVGILASTCSGCGVVDVKVDRATIGRITLRTPSAMNRQVLLLPAFAKTDGIITIKSVFSGRKIKVDGLVVIRTTSSPPTLP